MPIGPPDRRRRGPPQGVDTRGYEWANLPSDIARAFGRAGKAGLEGYATALTGVDDEGRTVGNVLPVARDERTGERALAAPRVLDLWNTVGGSVPARGITLGAGPVLRRGAKAAEKPLRLLHSTYDDFDQFDFGLLGRETAENATDFAPGQFSHDLSKIGAWLSDKNLVDTAYPGGKALEFDVLDAPATTFGSLDELHEAIKAAGGPEQARAAWLGEGKKVLQVVDEEFGGNSYVVLDPSVARRAKTLDMSTDARMARAREMGFDVDRPVYHGTAAPDLREFRDDMIGSANDAGHYGRGHYFAGTQGEAGYYGPNVGEYTTNARLLDLGNETGDSTFIGHFKSFGPKLRKIGALSEEQDEALRAVQAADKYIDENVEFIVGRNQRGGEGVIARVANPAPGFTDKIQIRPWFDGSWPKTKEEALEQLRHQFYDDMRTHHREMYPGLGNEAASLSDYVRTDLGAGELTRKAREAGYGGIRYGDETVIFDPRNIRSTQAAFDPARADSADLLAARAAPGAAASTVINEAGDALRGSDLPDQIARLLREGRAAEVTDDMLGALGPNEQRRLYELYESGATGMDMPMDEASRMARAREGGFSEPEMYHGTRREFPAFDPNALSATDHGWYGKGAAYLGDADLASEYAMGGMTKGNNVLPLQSRRRFFEWPDGQPMHLTATDAAESSAAVRDLGYDGINIRLSPDADPEYAGKLHERLVFDPANIRSRHARFDPRLSNNADLLASRAAPGAGIGLGDPNRRRRLTWQELENLL